MNNEKGLNVRKGAHTNYGIVTFLELDETMRLIGRNYQGSWLQALLDDERTGWVFADLIDIADEDDILDLPITWVNPTATLTPSPVPATFTPSSHTVDNSGTNTSGSSNSGSNNGGGGSNSGGGSVPTNPDDGGGGEEESNDGGLGGVIGGILGGLLP